MSSRGTGFVIASQRSKSASRILLSFGRDFTRKTTQCKLGLKKALDSEYFLDGQYFFNLFKEIKKTAEKIREVFASIILYVEFLSSEAKK